MSRAVHLLLAVALVPSYAAGQPFPVEDLPDELRPWVDWVLDQAPEAGCPRVRGRAVCLWPGRLDLSLGPAGGSFQLAAHADRDADLRLPGDAARWPQDVQLDGRDAPVFDRGGAPTLRLSRGTHRVSGRFAWSRLPESLPVPAELALLALSLDGRPVPTPRREASGLLWLRRGDEVAAGEGESLRLQVFRQLADGIPLVVETRVELEVSGPAREVELQGALLDESIPLSVSGGLPARVDANRTLRVQVRGGRYEVRVRGRLPGSPTSLRMPEVASRGGDAAWPEREVWVFAADERLREVELSGPAGIDPSRTELPEEWRALPAYLLSAGDELAIAERRRGQPEPPPDHLTLQRELWLDPSGAAFTVRDRFGGALGRTTRLDLRPPAQLGRVELDGVEQLVTASGEAAGVELRRRPLQLAADSRLPRGSALSAVGWDADVDGLSAQLNLPPGWTLLGSSGVDGLPGTWAGRWDLMSFFFVLLVGFASLKLMARREAVLAVAALVLSHGEPGAPWLVWLSLVAAMALRRAVTAGRLASLARIWWLASAVMLLVVLVPFGVDQVRLALFPQTGTPGFPLGGKRADSFFADHADFYASEGAVVGGVAGEPMAANVPPPPPAPAPGAAAPEEEVVEAEVRKDGPKSLALQRQHPGRVAAQAAPGLNVALEQDPQAVLQTGPGVPSWSWRQHHLSWSGPVGRDHEIGLWLVSPGGNLVLTLLRLALLALLAARLLTWPRPLKLPWQRAAAASAILLFPAATAARAQTPDPALLEELKQRLTRPAACEPDCVTTPELRVTLRGATLAFSAEVHTAADASWPVPGPLASWAPAGIRVDGAATSAIARLPDGFLHVRLSPGVHRVQVEGPAPPADSFTLQFGQVPRRAALDAPGWDAVGFRSDTPPEGSIQLTRQLRPGAAARDADGDYPPWLEITRTLRLGVSWSVATSVRRTSPLGSPVAVRVPLLAGEAPTDPAFQPEDGAVSVALARDQLQASWSSTLERSERLELTAPEGRPWSEVWRLQCSAIWSCRPGELVPIARWNDDFLEPEFHPWPGESLAVDLEHPEGVAGRSATVDRVELRATPGVRLETASLALQVRSSREQPLELGLPPGAQLQSLSLDGTERDARPDDAGRLRVSVPAGTHQLSLGWQREEGLGLWSAVPRVAIPDPAVNAHLTLELPEDRWLLLTWGPDWGPAVLFWGYLVFVAAVALLLGWLPGSPLSRAEWLLLGLGLSQIPAVGALIVAGFFFALAYRRRRPPRGALRFDLAQLGLAVWAVVAVVLLYQAVQTGLLFRPQMQVAGNGSSDTALRWYADRLEGGTPRAAALSAPLWFYRALMLTWALWLAARVVRWIGWGWRAFGAEGLWRPIPRPTWLRPRSEATAAPEAEDPREPAPEPEIPSER
jgi:hypothetical protein